MFNFKKESVFSRMETVENIPLNSSGVLAVWGSTSSGKTTVASKIAYYLASKRQNVILLLCDSTTPMIPCIIPPSELEVEKSLGSILAVPNVSENIVKYNMITLKATPHN